MKEKELVKLGLTVELAKKVINMSEVELKGFIPKSRFDQVNNSKKDLEKQIANSEDQLMELHKSMKLIEELNKVIKDLQDTNLATKAEYEEQMKEVIVNSAIHMKLADVKYADLLIGKVDQSKLSIAANGTVLGIDEQLTVLKETYKDLFMPLVKENEPIKKDRIPTGIKNPWSKKYFNVTEQTRILQDNPELAQQLKSRLKKGREEGEQECDK